MFYKSVAIAAPIFSTTGYAEHARRVVIGMAKLGWDINLFSGEYPEHHAGTKFDFMSKFPPGDERKLADQICIQIAPTPAVRLPAAYSVVYTTFESETIHQGALNRLSLFDEVWTPCEMNTKAVKKFFGKKHQVYTMPEGVDAKFWAAQEHEKILDLPDDVVKILYVGDWSQRKGLHFLLKAFFQCKTKKKLALVLKVNYQGVFGEGAIPNIGKDYHKAKGDYQEQENRSVYFVFDDLPEKDLRRLYLDCDIYSIMSMGEAWSLTLTQAMACGLPCITTKFSGHLDYCTKKNARLIKLQKKDLLENQEYIDVDFYRGQTFGYPRVDLISRAIDELAQDERLRKSIGWRAACDMREKYTWEASCILINNRLLQIYRTLDLSTPLWVYT